MHINNALFKFHMLYVICGSCWNEIWMLAGVRNNPVIRSWFQFWEFLIVYSDHIIDQFIVKQTEIMKRHSSAAVFHQIFPSSKTSMLTVATRQLPVMNSTPTMTCRLWIQKYSKTLPLPHFMQRRTELWVISPYRIAPVCPLCWMVSKGILCRTGAVVSFQM